MRFYRHGLYTFFLTQAAMLMGCGSIDPVPKDTDTSTDTAFPDGGDDSDSDSGGTAADDYYPMKVGDFWTYLETEGTLSVEFTYEVTGRETIDFGGETGERDVFIVENYSLESSAAADEGRTQYIENGEDRAVRHRQDIYDAAGNFTKERNFFPGFLRFDKTKLKKGDAWPERIVRVSDPRDGSEPIYETVYYDFEVLETDEVVELESGTFHCIKVERTARHDGEIKIYWYAKGIGKVQELTGGTKMEQLVDSSYL